jgi:fumarate reductase subunit C
VSDPIPPGEVAADVRVGPNGAVGPDVASAPPGRPVRAHPYRQPATWWLRRRGYVLYMVRELTAVPIAIWMVLFLVEVSRLRQGAGGYTPLGGPLFVAAGVVCLAAALWHSFTFLNLAGLIMRIPAGDRNVPPRVIVGAAFTGFALLTALVAGLLIWGGA